MTIKEIINEKDGNNIEQIIFNRLKRHVFMLYPFADVQVRLVSALDCKNCDDGEYVYIVSENIDFIMKLHPDHIQKMICQEFYNPFFEDDVRKLFKNFMEEATKKTPPNVVQLRPNKCKPCMWIYFKDKKKSVLKRILGGLGL